MVSKNYASSQAWVRRKTAQDRKLNNPESNGRRARCSIMKYGQVLFLGHHSIPVHQEQTEQIYHVHHLLSTKGHSKL